jgi:hypothetical protein
VRGQVGREEGGAARWIARHVSSRRGAPVGSGLWPCRCLPQ